MAGILGDAALLVTLSILFGRSEPLILFSASPFMAVLGLCVGGIVYLGIQRGKYFGGDDEDD